MTNFNLLNKSVNLLEMFTVQDLNPDIYFQGDLGSDPNQYEMDPEHQ